MGIQRIPRKQPGAGMNIDAVAKAAIEDWDSWYPIMMLKSLRSGAVRRIIVHAI